MEQTTDAASRQAGLVVATVGAFVTPFMASSITIAFPAIGREFAMDAILLSWVGISYSLAAAMFLVPFGKVGDIYGRKRVFTCGVLLYTLSCVSCAASPSAPVLLVSRITQGIGGAMMFGTGTAILTSIFPAGERGKVLGINVATVYVGLSTGPVLGGFLTQTFGWRSIFWTNVPLGILLMALVLWRLKGEWAEAQGETFDLRGAVIYSISLVALMYGFSQVPALLGGALILVGIAAITAFVWWELRVEHPILHMDLFRRNTVFAFSNLAALINYSATAAVGFLLSLYLQYVKGLTPQEAGLIMVAQPIVQAVFSPFAGRLSDRMEPRVVSSAGMALVVLGLSVLTLLEAQSSLAFIVSALVLLGLGFALFSSPNTNAVMSSVDRRFFGVASATLGTMRLTGQVFSLGVATLIIAVFLGKVQITPEVHGAFLTSMKTAFTLFAVLCFGGVFASLARGKVR